MRRQGSVGGAARPAELVARELGQGPGSRGGVAAPREGAREGAGAACLGSLIEPEPEKMPEKCNTNRRVENRVDRAQLRGRCGRGQLFFFQRRVGQTRKPSRMKCWRAEPPARPRNNQEGAVVER